MKDTPNNTKRSGSNLVPGLRRIIKGIKGAITGVGDARSHNITRGCEANCRERLEIGN